jgi:cyclopropane fatty-acyl-phospholipid synthase-like methyltransferase
MDVFHEVEAVPTNSCILLDSEQDAVAYPRGQIRLGFCSACGFISNVAFDARLTEYSGRYEETQGFSSTFNVFHRSLAERLIERFDLRGKDIIEIGCGKGEFLMLLCELGGNRGVGFDPGVHQDRIQGAAAERVRFIPDFYSEKYADFQGDFIACKMTLEHIQPTGDFIATVRRAIGDRIGTSVFFQIPEATRILRDCAFEDIYYEHCSYFSPGSLARLFRSNGFEVLDLSNEYGDQYLTIEARAATLPVSREPLPEEEDIDALAELVRTFAERFENKRREWRLLLEGCVRDGKKVAIWGAASKAVAFLSTVQHAKIVGYGVDINPYRQGHFLPGSGLPVVGPDFLAEYRPDLVLIMNRVYRREIAADLEQMGLNPEIVTL